MVKIVTSPFGWAIESKVGTVFVAPTSVPSDDAQLTYQMLRVVGNEAVPLAGEFDSYLGAWREHHKVNRKSPSGE